MDRRPLSELVVVESNLNSLDNIGADFVVVSISVEEHNALKAWEAREAAEKAQERASSGNLNTLADVITSYSGGSQLTPMSIGLSESSFQSFDDLTPSGNFNKGLFDVHMRTQSEEMTNNTNNTTGSAMSSLSGTPDLSPVAKDADGNENQKIHQRTPSSSSSSSSSSSPKREYDINRARRAHRAHREIHS